MTTISSIKISFSNRKYVFNDFDTSTRTEILFNNFEINSALGNPTVGNPTSSLSSLSSSLSSPCRRHRLQHRHDYYHQQHLPGPIWFKTISTFDQKVEPVAGSKTLVSRWRQVDQLAPRCSDTSSCGKHTMVIHCAPSSSGNCRN